MSKLKRSSSSSGRPSVHTRKNPSVHTRKNARGSASSAISGLKGDGLDVPERAKLLLVDFRSGEAVHCHPDVLPFLDKGWAVTAASPRVTQEGTRLLVVLTPPGLLAGSPTRRMPSGTEGVR